MREFVVLILVGVLLSVGKSLPPSSKRVKAIEIKYNDCVLDDIKVLGPANCSGLSSDEKTVLHGGNCTFGHLNGYTGIKLQTSPTVDRLTCINGHWSGTDFSVGDPVDRHKRFWGIVAAVVGGAVLGAVACYYLCPKNPGPGVPSPVYHYPPQFTDPCKPSEIEDNYIVAPGENSVKVQWTVPKAKKGTPKVEQIGGGSNGGQFQGSVGGKTHHITYKATDDKDLHGYCHFSFVVTVQTCTRPKWIDNGHFNCDVYTVGSQCQYECDEGYILQGDDIVTCENTEPPNWSTIPTCEKITCEPPVPPTNGSVNCNPPYTYQSICSMSCDEDFELQGQRFTICHSDGTWLQIEETSCIDGSPPTLTCKTPQIFYADRKSTSTSVTWEVPTATDRTDPTPRVFKQSGPSLGDVLDVGSEYVTYVAIDSDGNFSPDCVIELQVQEVTCGHPSDTLQDKYLEFECSNGAKYTYGEECSLSCLINLPLNGTNLITCEDNGSHVGVWDWGDDQKPFCQERECPTLDPPINGALVQDSIGGQPVYIMQCNENYDISPLSATNKFNGFIFCLDNIGWSPVNKTPDCIVPQPVRFLQLGVEIFYYGGECGTNETMEEIKQNFIDIMASGINPAFLDSCPDPDTCTAENLQIICGPIQRRKRRSDHVVQGRSINKHRKSVRAYDTSHSINKREDTESHLLVVEFDIILSVTLSEGETLISKIGYYDDIMANVLLAIVQDMLNNGTLDIQNFTTKSDSLQAPAYADLECDTGYFLDSDSCQPCPRGYYLNEETTACDECPIGQYTDVEGKVECMLCPDGYSTKHIGSKNTSDCIALCGLGTASPDGMEPCSVCLYREYQDVVGQTACKPCPNGTTTKTTNSSSSQECQNIDVLVEETGGPISLASIPNSMNNMTMMFWAKRVDEQSMTTILQMKSNGNDRCILYLTQNVRVQIPDTIDETVEELSSDIWTHVGVVWNTAVNMVDVYINGGKQFTSTFLVSSPIISNGELTLTASGQSGLYITGFHVLDRVLDSSEITTHASSCHVTETDDVIDMGALQEISVSGISVISSSNCDAVDYCKPDPCNGHQCIQGQGTYFCHCSSGWSGDTCLTPPDFCIDHECSNGATCLNGGLNYTCDCASGYSGPLCEIAPVNGGWSEWTISSTCTQNCGTGNQTRTRTCDSPAPDLYGADCVGDDEETVPCNTDVCQVCEDLPIKYGTQANCTTDLTTGSRTCVLICEADKIMPPGLQSESQEYTCGPETNYEWENVELLPSCVEPSGPSSLTITTVVEYNADILEADKPGVTDEVLNNIDSTQCSDKCQTTAQISNNENKLTVALNVDLSSGPDLQYNNYVTNGIVSTALQELVDSVSYLEQTAQYLQNYTSDVFTVTVNGATYAVDPNSLHIEGVVTCPDGQVAFDGACLECPAGTYSDGFYCNFCQRGTYQPSSGQSSCIQCPSSFTTVTIGSTALSQCSETITTTTTPQTEPTSSPHQHVSEPSLNKTVIVAVVLSVVALVIACLAIFLIWKKNCRTGQRIQDSVPNVRHENAIPASRPVHYRRDNSNVRFASRPSTAGQASSNRSQTRPVTPSQLTITVTDIEHGSEEDRYARCVSNCGYVHPEIRNTCSPPPPYEENDLPKYTEKEENPYNSIVSVDDSLPFKVTLGLK